LLVLALRALGWVAIGGFLGGRMPGLARWLLSFVVTVVLILSAVGLLRLREWARWLTLALCTIYFGLTLASVVVLWPRLQASRLSLGLGLLNAVEAVLVLALAWWYLNRKDVRWLFRGRG
jgi:hypothetical protein